VAKATTTQIKAAFAPYLPTGEEVTHVAYGVKQPHIVLILLLVSAGVLPGLIAMMIMTRHYLIGQSASGITVLRIESMNDLRVKEAMHFSAADLAAADVKTSSNALFTNISIVDRGRRFVAKFHKMYSADNRPHAEAIAAFAAGA
jgi:hypothetical protein